jgi:hypothetical protein
MTLAHDELKCVYPGDECGYVADNGICLVFEGGREICPYDKLEEKEAQDEDGD